MRVLWFKLLQRAVAHRLSRIAGTFLASLAWGSVQVWAAPPLHDQVDRLIAERADDATLAPAVDDAGFLRRVTLDFAGRIPAASELQAFLDDRSADKRQAAIDRLLAGPEYARRMADVFHVLLMERLGENADWMTFLANEFAVNQRLDRLFAEILDPAHEGKQARGSAYFYAKRLEKYGQNPTDYPGLTRDVGRLFLGVDLQCAQCHDHLTIDDYTQRDFQGLFAVYKNLNIDAKASFPTVVEKPFTSKLEFVSVFEDVKEVTGPRVPFGDEIELPDEREPASENSALALITARICSPENPWFARNLANRIWFLLMGRGLVEPLDEHHGRNQPTHPELLDLLTRELVASEFDLKFLLRELALSQVYQRSSVMPEGAAPPATDRFAVSVERRLSAEQIWRSVLQATGSERPLSAEGWGSAGSNDAKSESTRKAFIAAFGNPARVPETGFQASVKGALFLLNDGWLLSQHEPQAGNLADRLLALADPQQVVDELFLCVLSRLPDIEERKLFERRLEEHISTKEQVVRDLIWALLAGTEFQVNH